MTFDGPLGRLHLVDLLRLLQKGGSSGRLTVTGQPGGRLQLDRGAVVGAELQHVVALACGAWAARFEPLATPPEGDLGAPLAWADIAVAVTEEERRLLARPEDQVRPAALPPGATRLIDAGQWQLLQACVAHGSVGAASAALGWQVEVVGSELRALTRAGLVTVHRVTSRPRMTAAAPAQAPPADAAPVPLPRVPARAGAPDPMSNAVQGRRAASEDLVLAATLGVRPAEVARITAAAPAAPRPAPTPVPVPVPLPVPVPVPVNAAILAAKEPQLNRLLGVLRRRAS